jgi:uncharacterized protein (UPF0261 family)
MGEAFAQFAEGRDDIAGIIGIGGGGGTSIVTSGMRAPSPGTAEDHGVDARIRATYAPYVDVSDIIMMPSVTDYGRVQRPKSRDRLAQRSAGDRRHGRQTGCLVGQGKPSVGLTMFGVTTPCVMTDQSNSCKPTVTTAWSFTPPARAAALWKSSPTAACSPASSTSRQPRSATC